MNIRNLALSLILILSLAASNGCTLIADIGTSQQPSSPQVTENTTPSDNVSTLQPPSPQTTENITLVDSEWSIPPVEGQAPLLPSIADVVAKVKPSVVSINTEVVTFDIFRRPYTQEGAGSGWIISKDGVIVTNNHVVEGAKSVTVTLDDGRTFSVDLDKVATDPLTDLAVLKIDSEDLPAATVGDSSKLRVGDWVVAIGNSLGQGIRATQGIVSRKEVSLEVAPGEELYGLIETDAAINQGNSGGPLVNLAGEVIGITNAKQWDIDVGIEGVGYAISIQEAIPIIEQLINTGYVVHPWLGVSLYPVDKYVMERFSLTIDTGALIVEVADGSPADKAGLKVQDVIIGFAGKKIDTVAQLIQAIRSAQVGQEVETDYWRDNSKRTTHATLIERPTS